MWNAVRNTKRVRSTVKGTKRTCLRRTPSLSVVPLLLGDSDSLSVSYGMEPEQEALSIVSFKDREAASPVNKLNPKKNYLNSPSAIALIEDAYSEGVIPDTFLNCLEK